MHPSGRQGEHKATTGEKEKGGGGKERRRDERVSGLAKIKSNVKQGPRGSLSYGEGCTFHSREDCY